MAASQGGESFVLDERAARLFFPIVRFADALVRVVRPNLSCALNPQVNVTKLCRGADRVKLSFAISPLEHPDVVYLEVFDRQIVRPWVSTDPAVKHPDAEIHGLTYVRSGTTTDVSLLLPRVKAEGVVLFPQTPIEGVVRVRCVGHNYRIECLTPDEAARWAHEIPVLVDSESCFTFDSFKAFVKAQRLASAREQVLSAATRFENILRDREAD